MKGCTGHLKARIKRGDTLLQGMIHECRSGVAVEMFHSCGYDTLLIDREHTFFDNETVLEHIRLARALDMPVMVRVPEPTYAWVNCLLDQAPDGIFVPRIRTRAEVEELFKILRYPPQGVRGLGGSTCPAGRFTGWPHVRDQVAYFSENLVVGIQIETAEAYANLDSILSVPGLDIAVIGLDDLSCGLGITGEWNHPRFTEALANIVASCKKHGVLPGLPCGDPAAIARYAAMGFKVFWCASDLMSMWHGVRNQIDGIRAVLGQGNKTTTTQSAYQ
jgi:2-keto-3-deoxy-L-rhamnonate aldolase RhmA